MSTETENQEDNTKIDRDGIFKKIFGDKELFIMFMKDFITEEWTKNLTPEDITVMPNSFIDLREGNKESDIIYRINLKEQNEEIFIFLLLEHQSSVNHLMNFRMLEYMVKIWRAYIDEEDAKNINDKDGKPVIVSKRKSFMLPPVFPILFYEGEETWTVGKEFKNKVIDYEKFKKYVPNFSYELVDLNEIGYDKLEELSDAMALILTFDKIKNMEDFEKVKQMKRDVWDKLKELKGTRVLNILADVIKSFLKGINIPKDERDKIIDKIFEGRFSEMFTMSVDYDVVEVRKEAAREAREEAMREAKEEIKRVKEEAKKAKEEEKRAKEEEKRAKEEEKRAKEEVKKVREEALKEKVKIAKKMIAKGEPIEEIIEITELTIEEIEKID